VSATSEANRSRLVYDVVTPTLNEEENLPRLALSLNAQTVPPRAWTIVDTGSRDGTVRLAQELAREHPWIRVLELPGTGRSERGKPIVRAIQAAGEAARAFPPDVFVNIDADISFEPDYFELVLDAFAEDQSLGMVSGRCRELDRGVWRERFITGSSVWGATRSYRWACFQAVLPLEERLGWDGIDTIKANARGWRTGTIAGLSFLHHRPEGIRDGSYRSRLEQGRTAYYMGYRPLYLTLRALWNARREPLAVAMVWGYLRAALARQPRCADEAARRYLRDSQSLTKLPLRAFEARGLAWRRNTRLSTRP
jgi:glycosyltransferase involved in cell wall biosynthesis